jgi:DNA-binding phage protein
VEIRNALDGSITNGSNGYAHPVEPTLPGNPNNPVDTADIIPHLPGDTFLRTESVDVTSITDEDIRIILERSMNKELSEQYFSLKKSNAGFEKEIKEIAKVIYGNYNLSDKEKKLLADTLDNKFFHQSYQYKKYMELFNSQQFIGPKNISDYSGYLAYNNSKVVYDVYASTEGTNIEYINKLDNYKTAEYIKAYIIASQAYHNIDDKSDGAIYFEAKENIKKLGYADETNIVKSLENSIYSQDLKTFDLVSAELGIANNSVALQTKNSFRNVYFRLTDHRESIDTFDSQKAKGIFGDYEQRIAQAEKAGNICGAINPGLNDGTDAPDQYNPREILKDEYLIQDYLTNIMKMKTENYDKFIKIANIAKTLHGQGMSEITDITEAASSYKNMYYSDMFKNIRCKEKEYIELTDGYTCHKSKIVKDGKYDSQQVLAYMKIFNTVKEQYEKACVPDKSSLLNISREKIKKLLGLEYDLENNPYDLKTVGVCLEEKLKNLTVLERKEIEKELFSEDYSNFDIKLTLKKINGIEVCSVEGTENTFTSDQIIDGIFCPSDSTEYKNAVNTIISKYSQEDSATILKSINLFISKDIPKWKIKHLFYAGWGESRNLHLDKNNNPQNDCTPNDITFVFQSIIERYYTNSYDGLFTYAKDEQTLENCLSRDYAGYKKDNNVLLKSQTPNETSFLNIFKKLIETSKSFFEDENAWKKEKKPVFYVTKERLRTFLGKSIDDPLDNLTEEELFLIHYLFEGGINLNFTMNTLSVPATFENTSKKAGYDHLYFSIEKNTPDDNKYREDIKKFYINNFDFLLDRYYKKQDENDKDKDNKNPHIDEELYTMIKIMSRVEDMDRIFSQWTKDKNGLVKINFQGLIDHSKKFLTKDVYMKNFDVVAEVYHNMGTLETPEYEAAIMTNAYNILTPFLEENIYYDSDAGIWKITIGPIKDFLNRYMTHRDDVEKNGDYDHLTLRGAVDMTGKENLEYAQIIKMIETGEIKIYDKYYCRQRVSPKHKLIVYVDKNAGDNLWNIYCRDDNKDNPIMT